MAYVFPPCDDGAAHDDARLLLAGTLASLPQEWTALRDPNLEGAVVDAVLVHPEMGVALVSLAPAAPGAAAATLRERLEHEHFGDFFPGTLPVVVLGTTPRDIPEIEKRLADAFRQAPRLAIIDRDWADAVVALLLESSELEMAPVRQFAAFPREPPEPPERSDPEPEGVAPVPPSFLGLRVDNGAAPRSQATRRGDWLVAMTFTVVVVAELAIAFGGVKVGGLLPFSNSPAVRTEAALLPAPEEAPEGGELWPVPAPEEPLILLAAKPAIAPSLAPPIQLAPVAGDRAKLKYGEASKFRRHRVSAPHPAPTVNGAEHRAGDHRDHYALLNEIYKPGSRPPGW
jgi:hypothetical protein